MEFNDLIPRLGERAFICGMTGSGKSVLARTMLATRRNWLIYDAKNEIKFDGIKRYRKLIKLLNEQTERAIYAPVIEELDSDAYQNAFFKYGFERHNTTIYVDELVAVSEGNDLPRYFKACLTQGRSRGVETWVSSQRPISIPQWVISESENKYVFYLEMPQDREKMRRVMGLSEDAIAALKIEEHEFYFKHLKRRQITKVTLTGVK